MRLNETGDGNGRFDWALLMRAGFRGAGLRPWEFWRLTPAELMVMLGQEGQAPALSRGRLDQLLAEFPDQSEASGTKENSSA